MLRNAVVCFQYAERIKSELIIATKLLERLETLKDSELEGAKKLMLSFLGALESEVEIAGSVSGQKSFEQVGAKVWEATERIRTSEYEEAFRCLSEAISATTTSGQSALQTLKENGVF
jgi:hypothetical protein